MKLYCGTYKKYNEGSLFGKWMDLDDYEDVDSFYEACRELHKDEEDPELMFQDVEYEHDWENGLFSECSAPAEYWEIKEALEDSYIDDDIFDAFCCYECEKPSTELIKKCEEKYCGKYMTKRQINKHFRKIDDSEKWPIKGKFNATERAIRRIRKLFPELEGLEYAMTLENEISTIVNKEV